MKGGKKITNPPRERLQPWRGQSIASRWALPPARAVPCPLSPWAGGRPGVGRTTQGNRRGVGEQPAEKPLAPAGCSQPRWPPHLGHGHGTGVSPDLDQLLPPEAIILQQLLLDGLRLRLAAGQRAAVRRGTCPHPGTLDTPLCPRGEGQGTPGGTGGASWGLAALRVGTAGGLGLGTRTTSAFGAPSRRGGGHASCEARCWQRPRARGDRAVM